MDIDEIYNEFEPFPLDGKFSSDRDFVLQEYRNNGAQLVIRSPKGYNGARRIDISFRDVRAMELRCWTRGINVEEIHIDGACSSNTNPGEIVDENSRCFLISSAEWTGFVVASDCAIVLDNRGPDDPPMLNWDQKNFR